MSGYLLGLATIPAMAIGGYLLTWLVAHAIEILGRLHLGTLRRIRPEGKRIAVKRAAVVYGCRKGWVFSLGDFVLVIATDYDHDRNREALDALSTIQINPSVTLTDLGMTDPEETPDA